MRSELQLPLMIRKHCVLVSLHVIAVLVHVQLAEVSVTCSAGEFNIGERASIQCSFDKDVKQTRHNFNVVKHPLDSKPTEDSSVYVLLCNWQQNVENLQCKVEDGYSFDNTVSSSLTLVIAAVSKAHTGKYVCQLVPDEGSKVETCNLTLREDKEETCSRKNSTADNVGTPHSENFKKTNQSLLLAILVLVIVLLIIAIAHVLRRLCIQHVQTLRHLISNCRSRNSHIRSQKTCTYSNRLGVISDQEEETSLTEVSATGQKKTPTDEAADNVPCTENSSPIAEVGNRETPQSSAATKSAMQEKEAAEHKRMSCVLQ